MGAGAALLRWALLLGLLRAELEVVCQRMVELWGACPRTEISERDAQCVCIVGMQPFLVALRQTAVYALRNRPCNAR